MERLRELTAKIVPSTDWCLIQRMAIEAGLEPGDLGDVIQAWVTRIGKQTVGGVILLRSGRDGTIEWLSVLKKFRLRGIGTELVKTAIKEAKKKDFRRIVISMQIPDFFKKFGFTYATMESLSKDFFCYRCRRYNKSCFPVAMVLDLVKPQEGIEIQKVKDYPLLEKLAQEEGQEVGHQITQKIVKGWFALKGKKIIGGIGVFKWGDNFTLEYSFSTEDREVVQENLMKSVLLFCQKNGIGKIYYIRGAPDHLFPIEKFGFREIHWRDLPPNYRDFSLAMCDKCSEEVKRVCNPVAMMLSLGKPPKYVLDGLERRWKRASSN